MTNNKWTRKKVIRKPTRTLEKKAEYQKNFILLKVKIPVGDDMEFKVKKVYTDPLKQLRYISPSDSISLALTLNLTYSNPNP
jgi:hypothetical protein